MVKVRVESYSREEYFVHALPYIDGIEIELTDDELAAVISLCKKFLDVQGMLAQKYKEAGGK